MTVARLPEPTCESCGARHEPFAEVDFRDSSEPFLMCLRCAEVAEENGCVITEVEA